MKKRRWLIAAGTFVLVSFAWYLRMMDDWGLPWDGAGWLRTGLYLTLFLLWGNSVRLRVTQRQVRRYLTVSAGLMILWITVRAVKYLMTQNPNLQRYLWYSYYLPLIFLPLYAVFIGLSLGKSEEDRLLRRTQLLVVCAGALLLFVFTNDLHQLIFRFPEDAVAWTDLSYSHADGYSLVLVWIAGCAASAFVLIGLRSRVPGSRKRIFAPMLPTALILLYAGGLPVRE